MMTLCGSRTQNLEHKGTKMYFCACLYPYVLFLSISFKNVLQIKKYESFLSELSLKGTYIYGHKNQKYFLLCYTWQTQLAP